MSITPEEARTKAATTYNAAADSYNHPANTFWNYFGQQTVAHLSLQSGEKVLDVCCGSGASAIPSASKVGPTGSVLAVDLAEQLIVLGRTQAQALQLSNIKFRVGDMLSLGFPDNCFDAVTCVFGIFFIPDMTTALKELWRMVRPGGHMAITTWGPNLFEPANSIFWNAIREVRPELYKGFNPWDRISDPSSLRDLLKSAGVNHVEIIPESSHHAIPTPEAWWALVNGSGYRGTLEQLDPQMKEHVRSINFSKIQQESIHSLKVDVMYAIAKKEL